MGLLLILMHGQRHDDFLSRIACDFSSSARKHAYIITVRAIAAILTSMMESTNMDFPFPPSPQQHDQNSTVPTMITVRCMQEAGETASSVEKI